MGAMTCDGVSNVAFLTNLNFPEIGDEVEYFRDRKGTYFFKFRSPPIVEVV